MDHSLNYFILVNFYKDGSAEKLKKLVLTGISAWKEQILEMDWYLIQRMLREVHIWVFEGRKAGSKCKFYVRDYLSDMFS
jgi:hypothetical protein